MKNLFRILVLTAFAACLATGSFAAGPLSQGKQKRSAPQVAVGDRHLIENAFCTFALQETIVRLRRAAAATGDSR